MCKSLLSVSSCGFFFADNGVITAVVLESFSPWKRSLPRLVVGTLEKLLLTSQEASRNSAASRITQTPERLPATVVGSGDTVAPFSSGEPAFQLP